MYVTTKWDANLGTRKTKTGESKVWNTNLMKNQRREVETTTLAEISKNREEDEKTTQMTFIFFNNVLIPFTLVLSQGFLFH